MVRLGSVGVYVCVLQDALNVITGTSLDIDGVFGPLTCARVRVFQALGRLTADGVVGCATWQMLTSQAVGRG